MGFIREPEGIDFVIGPSPSVKDDIAYISGCIRQHKENDKAYQNLMVRTNIEQKATVAM